MVPTYAEILIPCALTLAAAVIAWSRWRKLRWLFLIAIVYLSRQLADLLAGDLTGHGSVDRAYWGDALAQTSKVIHHVLVVPALLTVFIGVPLVLLPWAIGSVRRNPGSRSPAA